MHVVPAARGALPPSGRLGHPVPVLFQLIVFKERRRESVRQLSVGPVGPFGWIVCPFSPWPCREGRLHEVVGLEPVRGKDETELAVRPRVCPQAP